MFVTLLVDKPELSRSLTYGKSRLNEILVIRILNSSDFFISIEANWLPTVFGIDLTYLCLLKTGIRTYTYAQLSEMAENLNSHNGTFSKLFLPDGTKSDEEFFDSASIRFSIPRQIRILVDFLYRIGDHSQVETNIHRGVYQYLCECLNYGVEINLQLFLPAEASYKDSFNDCITPLNIKITEIIEFESIVKSWNIKSSMALSCGIEVLFSFLESMPEPIIPYSVYHRVISEGYQSLSAAKTLLYKLPPTHYNLFIYICSFFIQWLKKDKKGVLEANMSKYF